MASGAVVIGDRSTRGVPVAVLYALIAGLGALGILALHLTSVTPIPWHQRLLGAVVGMIAWGQSWWYVGRRNFDRFPFVEFALLQIYLYWGLPTALAGGWGSVPIQGDAMQAALTGVIVLAALIIAFAQVGRVLGRRARPTLERLLPPTAGPAGRMLLLPWFLFVAWGAASGSKLLPSSIQHLANLMASPEPFLTFLALWAIRENSQRARTLLYGATAVLVLAALFTGRTELVVRPVLTLGLLLLTLERRVPWTGVAVAIALIVALQPAKLVYRSLAWDSSAEAQVAKFPATDVSTTFDNWGEAMRRSWLEGEHTGENLGRLARRLNELQYIALTFEMTPKLIPHDYGSQWKYALTSPIPRALMPDKPNFTQAFNHRFNVVFGIQQPWQTKLAVGAFPLLADAYWNFGWWGVIFVGAFMGMMLGVFSTMCSMSSWGSLALATALLVRMQPCADFTGQVSGLFQQFVGLGLVCWGIYIFSLMAFRGTRRVA